MFRIRVLVAVLAAGGCLSATAQASETTAINVKLSPNTLGASTTIVFSFKIGTTDGSVPSPLSNVDVRLPANMDIATQGLDTCDPTDLLAKGPSICPVNARAGFGSTVIEVLMGGQLVQETVTLNAFMGQPQNGHTVLLLYAEGKTPISDQMVLQGQFLPDSSPFSQQLSTPLPLIPTVPGGPDAAVISFTTSIGTNYLTYHHIIDGQSVLYYPKGITVPKRCPARGFPFAANFSFVDGTTSSAKTIVRCPQQRQKTQ
jgi:hypothetical protein